MNSLLEDDMNTVSNGIELFLFQSKTHYKICGVIICDIECDIQFKYDVLNDLQIIHIDFINEKIIDDCYDSISLFSINLSYNDKIHSNKKLCRLSLETILEMIPTLYFDSLIGRFLPPVSLHSQSSKLQEATKNIFSNIGIQIKDNSQPCIVCYVDTITQTTCNHALCFVCCSKIVETTTDTEDEEEDEGDDPLVRCPVCRAMCVFKRKGGCE